MTRISAARLDRVHPVRGKTRRSGSASRRSPAPPCRGAESRTRRPSGNLAEGALDGRPFAPRAALDALADCGEQLLRPVAQGLLHDAVALSCSYGRRVLVQQHKPVLFGRHVRSNSHAGCKNLILSAATATVCFGKEEKASDLWRKGIRCPMFACRKIVNLNELVPPILSRCAITKFAMSYS